MNRMRSPLAAVGVLAVAAALASTPAAAAPKPKLKLREACPFLFGTQHYGGQLTGKGFPANEPIDVGFSWVTRFGEFGDSDTLQADEKGRFGPVSFATNDPLESLTGFATAILSEVSAEPVTIEDPCQ